MDALAALSAVILIWALVLSVGFVVARCWGAAPTTAAMAAPPVFFAALSALAFTQHLIHVPFTVFSVTCFFILLTLLGRGVHLRVRSRGRHAEVDEARPGEGSIRMAVLRGLGLVVVAGCIMVIATGFTFETSSQTWDAMNHTNSVRAITETGIANPWAFRDSIVLPGTGGYYPSGFASSAALVMTVLRSDAVVASNVTATVLAGAVWTSSIMLMVRIVVTRKPWLVGTSGVLALGFWGMPWSPLGHGVLWPTLGAAAFTPLAVAGLASFLGLAHGRSLSRGRALLLVAGSLIAVGLYHPRGLLLAAPILALVWLAGMARLVVLGNAGDRRKLLLGAGGVVLACAVPLISFVTTGGRLIAYDWPITESFAGALVGHLVGGPNHSLREIPVAVLVGIGIVFALRSPRWRWLPFAWLALVLLDVATATNRSGLVTFITRFWYGDRYRSATMDPVLGVILATVGAQVVGRTARRMRGRLHDAGRRSLLSVGAAASAVVLLAASVIPSASSYIASSYIDVSKDPTRSLVSPAEIEFFHQIKNVVPEGARILNNSTDGSGLIYAYTGIKVTFFVSGTIRATPSAARLQASLVTDPAHWRICTLFKRDAIGWVVNLGRTYNDGSIVETPAPGMEIPDGFWATTLVLKEGDARLYQVTGCG